MAAMEAAPIHGRFGSNMLDAASDPVPQRLVMSHHGIPSIPAKRIAAGKIQEGTVSTLFFPGARMRGTVREVV